ncbi:hypothetical protein S7711_04644 [Stachybotrys chartarum IBT 7711]|uniref:Uncharacterized protein n=1 Tax=Stachybotrys chartarum (strain CBS 109288 / IBT 7711) TaxID=1280523 RepID=A0A084B5Z1_STACB|nr:hypothetical protein S7711_04644 [Stachybotrys chartarum IBT 7711]
MARDVGAGAWPGTSKPCFHFQKGTCRYGATCRFSHDTEPRRSTFSRAEKPQGAVKHPRDGNFLEWKRLLDRAALSPFTRQSTDATARVFQLGLELMEGDVGAAQDVIKRLCSDSGLDFIGKMADQHALEAQSHGDCLSFWEKEAKPLFQLLTHPRVVDSAVLEQEVAALFNYMLGVGGDRMARLFACIHHLIRYWPPAPLISLTSSRVEVIELSLAVLTKIMDCNSTNIVNEHFSGIVAGFTEFLEDKSASQPNEDFARLQAAKYIEYIQRRLRVGEAIVSAQDLRVNPVTREEFILRKDFPGHLSAQGPRHDNDFAEIHRIAILPTQAEVTSLRAEYLPTTNPSQWHIQGMRGRLDREFRLLREDTVGQLRDTVRETLERIQKPKEEQVRRSKNKVGTFTYDFAYPVTVDFTRHSGLEVTVRCSQPATVRTMALRQRKDWWVRCRYLQTGAVVCVLDASGSVLFFEVAESTKRTADDTRARQKTTGEEQEGQAKKEMTLAEDPDYLYVNLQLIEPGNRDIKSLLRWYRSFGLSPRKYLVEFPGVLLASFKPVLESLQGMYRKTDIPFSHILAPEEPLQVPDITPAPYTQKPGFEFDLRCIAKENDMGGMKTSSRSPLDPEDLSARSALDLTQSSALLNTMNREFSLIQGPPGTGKSYTGEQIIKVLLANKSKAGLGPILCVCYTNHALDQLLEHILDHATKRIVRIGSRSKSERLQGLNLRFISKNQERTKLEGAALHNAYMLMNDTVHEQNEFLTMLAKSDSWTALEKYLEEESPLHHAQLFGKQEDGWEIVRGKDKIVERWLHEGSRTETPVRRPEALQSVHVFSMTHLERRQLYRHWIQDIQNSISSDIISAYGEYEKARAEQNRVYGEVDLRCLQQADVIGVTTTGLARNAKVLRKLRCKVLLCEEAGEVLEAHILTALIPSLEHAILIGDHLQLRPQIQNYELQSMNPRGEQFSLDMSLFERLVRPPHDNLPQLPFDTLETQRRMHPSISTLIRSTLYPSLQDGPNVLEYPQVRGMRDRLFWLHHENLEGAAESNDPINTSHSNNFEVEMTTALVTHLVRQGIYAQSDIAVITPYLGQLQRLRRRMESMFEISVNDRDLADLEALEADDAEPSETPVAPVSKSTLLNSVRIATVDNFQGEEASIVVISLVRSNPQGKCGFLSTSNRINVLLSRAKHGMYIIGNSNTCLGVPMWADVIKMLKGQGCFGDALQLQCPRHPDLQIMVSQPDHFLRFSPESPSLCGEPCPNAKFCQDCGSDQVKNTVVDFLEMKEYREIDLDEEPCIFPDCGHFLTVSSMDGQMDMKAHYDLDNDVPVAIRGASKPFSMDTTGVRTCPNCRGSLRNVARYGRIVRRAMLDEATKKFMTWSHGMYLDLGQNLLDEQEKLREQGFVTARPASTKATQKQILSASSSRIRQLQILEDAVGNERYRGLIMLWLKINRYSNQVAKDEQPFQRVADLVRHANRQRKTQQTFRFEESVLQVKGKLLAASLQLKCDIVALTDMFGLCQAGKIQVAKVKLDLSKHISDCAAMTQLAKDTTYPREEVQGHIYSAQLIWFDWYFKTTEFKLEGPASDTNEALAKAQPHIDMARALLDQYPSTAVLRDEVDAIQNMIKDGTYEPVTVEEIRAVYAAMAREFLGTGHWYTCENGHPFTIGECGMPMEQARCPECRAPVGGQGHIPVDGVTRARNIEELGRGLEQMRM